jgi:hypothetical protein
MGVVFPQKGGHFMNNAQEVRTDERVELAEIESAARALEKRIQRMLKALEDNKKSVGAQVFKAQEKPRVNKTILAEGYALTTVKGSLYTAILTAMGKLGSLNQYDSQITCYNDCKRAKLYFHFEQFLRTFGVRDWQIEAFVRSDPDFQAHCEKQTARLQERAAHGDAKAKKVLANPKICVGDKWRGDFETAYEVLRQGHCPVNTRRRRNLAILNVAGLLFDEIRLRGQRLFFLYPEKYHKEFSEIKAICHAIDNSA